MSDTKHLLLSSLPRHRAMLQHMSPQEITQAVLEWFDAQERETFVDADRLISVGHRVRLAGHDHLDVPIDRWLQDAANCRRMDIASLFLSAYWATNRPISTSLTDTLLRGLPNCEGDSSVLHSILLALSQVPESGALTTTKSRTRGVLGEYVARANELKLQRGTLDRISHALQVSA